VVVLRIVRVYKMQNNVGKQTIYEKRAKDEEAMRWRAEVYCGRSRAFNPGAKQTSDGWLLHAMK